MIIAFKVTPEEKAWIEENLYGNYRRVSNFVRDCIFKKKIVHIKGADDIARELQRIGNNPKHGYTVGNGLFDLLKNLLGNIPYEERFTPPIEDHQLDKMTVMTLEMMGIKVEPITDKIAYLISGEELPQKSFSPSV